MATKGSMGSEAKETGKQMQEKASQAMGQAQEKVEHAMDQTQQKVETMMGQVQEKAGPMMDEAQHQMKGIADQAQEQVKSVVTSGKEQAAQSLGSIAEAFRQTGEQLRNQDKPTAAHYTHRMADQVEQISKYLAERDIDQLLEETESFARHQPEIFLGGAFALGLLFARFVKSSSERWEVTRRGPGSYQPTGKYPMTTGHSAPPPVAPRGIRQM